MFLAQLTYSDFKNILYSVVPIEQTNSVEKINAKFSPDDGMLS